MMKRFERPRTSISSQPRSAVNSVKKDQKPRKGNGLKPLNAAQLVSRVLDATAEPSLSLNDSTTGSESSEVYENVNVHYMDDDDARSSEHVSLEEGNGDEYDAGIKNDSVSLSQEKRSDRPSRVPKSKSCPDRPLTSKGRTNVDTVRSRSNTFQGTVRTAKSTKGHAKVVESENHNDEFEDALNSIDISESDNETIVSKDNKSDEVEQVLTKKFETLETRIRELEEELKEMAALEISLYSVCPEHGSSFHKFHKPARDLFRLYTLARKNQSAEKLISVTKNILSGLFLVLKSVGNDVSRLTFWLSNCIILREIISQEFVGANLNGSKLLEEDWTDARVLIAALRRVESCLFTQAVGSIWTQVIMVHMRPQAVGSTVGTEMVGNFSEPATYDRLQESFSVNLWKKAFEEALQRLCPIQAAGCKCGCLHILAKMVMKQCIARLDVAMFNAILCESAHQIPTDSVYDLIGDPRVLPIPAGVLSFESGLKLKNTVGYWSRLLTEIFETEIDDTPQGKPLNTGKNNHMHRGEEVFEPFRLLNELSDLLMLPKEMILDSSTRDEICPSIGLNLIKRILCNFTPDEFSPYPVPGTVLEELNVQCMLESKSSSGNATRDFPFQVNPVSYCLPSCAYVTDMIADFSDKLKISATQNNGYDSNEDLEASQAPSYYSTEGGEEKDNIKFIRAREMCRLLGEAWLV